MKVVVRQKSHSVSNNAAESGGGGGFTKMFSSVLIYLFFCENTMCGAVL